MMKIAGSGSGPISQRLGSADPDPYQDVMDPQHCSKVNPMQCNLIELRLLSLVLVLVLLLLLLVLFVLLLMHATIANISTIITLACLNTGVCSGGQAAGSHAGGGGYY
jgi:hypothetical protein